ncbi:cytochrome P450 [Thelonectria olida]|uniref:Cytochrome P450 n=1 Tax=Thelonectria olida TaxID=1576542 RepID=A0A9P9ALH2_9HYPO|nr:cytochrome P450 [Thelonectria olida]
MSANTKHITAVVGVLMLLGYVLFRATRAIYRIYFHPLKNFPGPREARTSGNWLYRVTKEGSPNEVFENLHRNFNCNALRIAPNELHISDVSLYKVIYSQSSPFPKSGDFYSAFNIPHTLLTETDAKAHKERRRMLNSLFSRVGVLKLQPIIHDKLDLLGDKINRLYKDGPVNVYDAFRLLTTEVVMQFAFARSADLIGEDAEGFHSWFLDAFDLASQSIFDMQHNPWLRFAGNLMPRPVVRLLSKEVGTLLDMREYAENSLRYFQQRSELPNHPVVFDNLRSLPDVRSIDEAQDIMVAGADTTAFTLTTGTIHILSNPEIYEKLVEALDQAIPKGENFPPLLSLEKIDYLTAKPVLSAETRQLREIANFLLQNAIVKESLRIASAVPGRLPRVVPNGRREPLIVDGKVIPPGSIVSISAYTMHTETDIWGPDAREFNPDRWLMPDAKGLDQYLCSFSKGTRMCLGQNIATVELTVAFAWIFRRYRLSLPEDFKFPAKVDRFTNTYLAPGVKVNMVPRV